MIMEPINSVSYQRELALSLAVEWTSKAVFDAGSVTRTADTFLAWLTNEEGSLDD